MPTEKNSEKEKQEKPFFTEAEIQNLREGLLKDYHKIDQDRFLIRCERTKMDPFANQLYIRPEKEQRDKDGLYPAGTKFNIVDNTIHGLRAIADRSGQLNGTARIEWCGKNADWIDVWLLAEPPAAARATVLRKDHQEPTVAVVRWAARAQTKNTDTGRVYTRAWAEKPDEQLGKCAEAAALRKAFPNQLYDIYIKEEDWTETEPPTPLETDIAAQQARILADAEALAKAQAAGTPIVTPPGPPRDAKSEVEPAFPEQFQNKPTAPVAQPPVQTQAPAQTQPAPQAPNDRWFLSFVLRNVKHDSFKGVRIDELSAKDLHRLFTKWVPLVYAAQKDPAKGDPTESDWDHVKAIELAWAELQRVEGLDLSEKVGTALGPA